MERKTIKIANSFTDAPGARNVDEGEFSGEAFLNEVLLPEFNAATSQGYKLLIDLDEAEGYATSFLEEAFGGLTRLFNSNVVLKTLDFKSEDEPLLNEEIRNYIIEAVDKKAR